MFRNVHKDKLTKEIHIPEMSSLSSDTFVMSSMNISIEDCIKKMKY